MADNSDNSGHSGMESRDAPSYAQRKKMLLVEGAIYRYEIMNARETVRSSLHATALAKSAIGHFTATASAAVENIFNLRNLQHGGLKTLLPLVMTGVSLLSKRGLVRPVLKVTLILGAAVAAAYVVVRKKRRAGNEE